MTKAQTSDVLHDVTGIATPRRNEVPDDGNFDEKPQTAGSPPLSPGTAASTSTSTSAPDTLHMGSDVMQDDEMVYAGGVIGTTESGQGWLPAPQAPARGLNGLKFCATDIDGTFLCENHRMQQSAVDAYEKLMADGVLVVPATGRTPYGLREAFVRRDYYVKAKEGDSRPFSERFQYHPGVYVHGALVLDEHGNTLQKHAVPEEAVIRFATCYYEFKKSLVKRGALDPKKSMAAITVYMPSEMVVDYQPEDFLDFCRKYEEHHNEALEADIIVAIADSDSVVSPSDSLAETEDIGKDETSVAYRLHPRLASILTISATLPGDLVVEFEAYCRARMDLDSIGCRLVCPVNEQLHLMRADASKATGLDVLCRRYGWKPSEFLALGDADNDLEMVGNWAGHGVAMGNASPALKSVAKEIVANASQGGWKDTVYKYFYPSTKV